MKIFMAHLLFKKKGASRDRHAQTPFLGIGSMLRESAAARTGIGAAAAAATAAAELDAAIQLETVHMKIDFYGLGAIQKFLVDDVFKTAHIEFLILFIRLIQSHGQARSASAAFV
jgi:hypothetical protein